MKNLLRKLHIGGSHDDTSEGSKSSSSRAQDGTGILRGRLSFTESNSSAGDLKPLSGLSGWLNTVARHTLQTGSTGQSTGQGTSGGSPKYKTEATGDSPTDEMVPRPDAGMAGSRSDESTVPMGIVTAANTQANEQLLSLAEEYQVQLAMALSANDDPEAVQIERVKQISLNSYPSALSTPAEVIAYRYWNYNVLNYDDTIVDGFYDVYGVVSDPTTEMMPSLVDLQGTPVSNNFTWEAVLVNRAMDPDLVNLEQRAHTLAVDCKADVVGLLTSGLIQRIADLVVEHMGGPVVDADDLLKQWRTSCEELRLTLKNIVLPLGRLRMGLARHRALLFKVLADGVEISCRLVKGRHYTGSDEGAVNIIKVDAEREYIIDLMGAPGTLIPADATGLLPSGINISDDEGMKVGPESMELPVNLLQSTVVSDGSNVQSAVDHALEHDHEVRDNMKECLVSGESSETVHNHLKEERKHIGGSTEEYKHVERHHSEPAELKGLVKLPIRPAVSRSSHPFAHWRSPSWTEGIGSPAVRDMKVKDVSQYMMDAAKENPQLAQKLHDVLLESGVVAPPDLFTDISPKQLHAQVTEDKKISDEKQAKKEAKGNNVSEITEKRNMEKEAIRELKGTAVRRKEKSSVGPGRPPAPVPKRSTETEEALKDRLQRLNSVEGLGERRPLAHSHASISPISSPTATSHPRSPSSCPPLNPVTPAASTLTVVQESLPPEVIKRVPVAAAAAATAAVVASSMVAAAAKSDLVPDPTLEVPVAAAATATATATAAVVVATSAVVGRKIDVTQAVSDAGRGEYQGKPEQDYNKKSEYTQDDSRRLENTDAAVKTPMGTGQGEGTVVDLLAEEDRVSDKSSGSISARFDPVLDDVAEWEIPWEDITIGERIGLGSYGEVYRGDWHGTEVAVKKFLDQDISGDALEEFRSEVRIMRRMRHPNVVLFMGAVTRAPNLSIVTEFLPRGSLYRLIHRPNHQLDERKRMRMALDVARGMNYLHSGTPVIVHRDLKSPNLLVDKNWVVKVCDFGLSRMKHNTFLSSKSTAGTPEWMAPEVLRNEPSNEKCDVYSFGVILWELATLQQPWGGMNPMQVVGAVGFQHRHLDIPDDMDPIVAKIICQCWQSNPNSRPSFADILAALKPLQRSLVSPRTVDSNRPGMPGVLNRPPLQQQPIASAGLPDNVVEEQ